MPISPSDLVLYASQNMPLDDDSPSGGAADTSVRPALRQMPAPSKVAVYSDDADNRQISITGRIPGGLIVTETITLNGTYPVITVNTYERVLRAVLGAASSVRSVTLTNEDQGFEIATIPPGELGVTAMFVNSYASSTPGDVYEKVFWKNNHPSLTLSDAQVVLKADPASRIRIGLSASKNDNVSVSNRRTPPPGVVFVDENIAVDVPGNTLEPGDVIGVWINQTLPVGSLALLSSYTLHLRGTSPD